MTTQSTEALACMAATIAGLGRWSCDVAGTTVECSSHACLICDLPVGASPSTSECLNFFLPPARAALGLAFRKCATLGVPFDLEVQIRTPLNREIWIRCAGRAVRDKSQAVQTILGVVQDIDERKKAESGALVVGSRLEYLVRHDALTGLLNRNGLEAEYSALLRKPGLLDFAALIYIDLDHFKDINDARGRAAGDSLLASVAARLEALVAEGDLLARAGGDEFVVIAAGVRNPVQLKEFVARLAARLEETIEIDGAEFGITASMGVTMVMPRGRPIEALLREADIALSKAKEHDRGSYMLFAPHMEVQLEARVAMEQALRGALATTDLFIEYQAIFDLGSVVPVAAEALLRWRHPELGLVPPATFIPIAEQSAIIIALGDRVMREVCRQIAQWRQSALVVVPIYVNVSPRQLEQPGFQEKVAGLMQEYSIPNGLLCFEITEGAVVRHVERNHRTLQGLRSHGARIAIDDFGTGYSSLSYLKALPIDTLKIDRAFIRDMCRSAHDLAIVAAIIVMARTLGLRTVAEGVETSQQFERLKSLKCDAAQGFHLGRPESPAQLQRRLTPVLPRGATLRAGP